MSQPHETEQSSQVPDATSSHKRLVVVICAAVVVMALALATAFLWPGWALSRNDGAVSGSQSQEAKPVPTTPSIKAKELPADATSLLKAMPDSVLNFARLEASPSDGWSDSKPLEEYALKYSTVSGGSDVALNVAQWSSDDAASKQYDDLAKSLNGSNLAQGDVKVSDNVTGRYVVRQVAAGRKNGSEAASGDAGKRAAKSDADAKSPTVALWRNDTVVFEATGTKESVLRFYQKFPL